MKLDQIILTNFRCFTAETINLNRFTAFVGPNNCGKSTIFKAIDIFFRTTQKNSPITLTDFQDPSKELRIALTFSELPEPAKEEFKHYFRHDKLEFFIKAKLVESNRVEATIHGSRSGIPEFSKFFSTTGAANQKAVYTELRGTFSDLPDIPTKGAVGLFENALREFEAANVDKQSMLESEDLAFGASGIAAKLKRYIDWIYIPAVKDASEENEEARNTAFGALIARIIRSKVKVDEKLAQIRAAAHETISELIGDYKDQVKVVETALDEEFRKLTSANAHIHLDWAELNESNVSLNLPLIRSRISDETFRGDIASFGHGLQRNYLISLVHVAAKLGADEQPSLVLACEEPELYQHPPQARYLCAAFAKLAASEQVLVTTHSAYFVSARSFGDIRAVSKKAEQHSKVTSWNVDAHRKLISEAIGEEAIGAAAAEASLDAFLQPELAEAFFCGKLVLVEGAEDRAILQTMLEHSGHLEEFLRCGCHVVGAHGKPNLINLIAIARGFKIDHFVMFDGDTACQPADVESTKVLNGKIASLLQLPKDECCWPASNKFFGNAVIWKHDIQTAMQADYPNWVDDVRGVCQTFGWQYARLKKNPAVLAYALTSAVGKGVAFPCLNQAIAGLAAWGSA